MADHGSVVIVGGTSIFGTKLAEHYAGQGRKVYVTSRSAERANALAAEIGGDTTGLVMDLSKPHDIEATLEGVDDVEYVVLLAVERDANSVKDYNIDGAIELVVTKLVGYTEVIHVLAPRMRKSGSIVLYGGNAREWPYPGSTTVTTANGGITTMVKTLGKELAPIRVNAIHPSVVGDTPFWANKPAEVLELHRSRTTIGRLVTVADCVDATIFLLENPAVAGVNLDVDGGTNLR